MSLSSDLIAQFVKVTKDDKKTKKETITYGVVKEVKSDGTYMVELDGADGSATPAQSTVDAAVGNRVVLMIKNHTATVTGNISNPSAKSTYSPDEVTEMEIVVSHRVTTEQLNAINANIDALYSKAATVGKAYLIEADIETLRSKFANVEEITADDANIINATITNIEATFADIKDISTEDLTAINAEISSLKAYTAEFTYLSADVLKAITASIKEIQTDKLSAKDAELKYANIDFSNIDKAAIEVFFSKSGMIVDLVVGEQTITGKLVGVTISGDLIEASTVKADKLVVKGSDGLYYKLNIEAGATTSEQVSEADLQNGLHGTAIIAKTITAEKISVDDLVAFGATIGGFTITDDSLYSGAKDSVNNTTRGTYLDDDGQVAFGDGANFLKYYKDSEGNYKLIISASSLILSSSNKNVEDEVNHAQDTADDAKEKVTNAETLIAQLSDRIAMLVTDGNGTSLMTQTEDGWTFSTAEIQESANALSEALHKLSSDVDNAESRVGILQQAVADLGELAEYIKITTYEDEPCIELGEGDSDFKLRITNTRMMFTEGSTVLAYFTNQSFHSKKIVIEEELQQGGFVWKSRSNGNLGLVWKGGNN